MGAAFADTDVASRRRGAQGLDAWRGGTGAAARAEGRTRRVQSENGSGGRRGFALRNDGGMRSNGDMPSYSILASSGTPIYRQFVEQTCGLVAGGFLSAGDAVPTVRDVAACLGVNPQAVSKAYALLARAGILVRGRGVAMVVAERAAHAVARSPYAVRST